MGKQIFTKEEYLALVVKLADQQYGMYDEEAKEIAWDPAESEVKEKFVRAQNDGTIDLSKTKKDKIRESLFKHKNIKVYGFLIRITFYHGEPTKAGANLTVDITLYHDIHETQLSRAPCKMTVPFSIDKDDRFTNRPWLSYFEGCHGKKLTPEIMIDLVRWMQAVSKLPAFL